jgi:hypothetical protein
MPAKSKGFRPDGRSAAVLIPPAFGLAGVNLHTWTGWGSVTYWNALVANPEMHGEGTFFDPRLNDPVEVKAISFRGSPTRDCRAQQDKCSGGTGPCLRGFWQSSASYFLFPCISVLFQKVKKNQC